MPVGNSSGEVRFLSGLDNSYSRETRAFVQRKHHFQRLRDVKRRRNGYDEKDKKERTDEEHPPPSSASALLPLGSDNAGVRQRILSPLHRVIGQGRADPFQSCVKVLTHFEQEMCDRWIQTTFTDYNVCRPTCFNVHRDLLYNCCRQDESLVYMSVCYAVSNLESRGVAVNQMQALQSRQSLYASINFRVNTEGRNPSWRLLMIMAGIICCLSETRHLAKDMDAVAQEIRMHINGFRSLVQAKGGWYAATTGAKELTWVCAWTDIAVYGEVSIGSVLPPADPVLSFSPSQYGYFPIDLCLILYAEEFVRAYAAFRHLAFINRRIPSTSCLPLDLFRKGSHVYQLIETGASRALRPICALLLVHLILQFCQNQSSTSQFEWFKILKSRLEAVDALRNGSVEATIWGLMTDMRTLTLWHRECLAVLARNLYVECRLRTSTQRKLKDTLLQFLDVEPANRVTGKRLESAWWTPEAFRNILYRDLGYGCDGLTEN